MEQFGGLKGVVELTYGVLHLPKSFEQKRKANVEEAQDFLSHLKNTLPSKNPYFAEGDELPVVQLIDSGFHSACYGFKSSTGKWVVKIGHEKSPMKTKFHPSMPEYAESYLRNLEIQRLVFGDKLPNFIPEPQGVFYVKGRERKATIVVQPFVDHVSPFDKQINFNPEERQQLRGELSILKSLLGGMRTDYGIMSDFMRASGKKGHLVVARKTDGAHFVMLDNGVFNQRDDPTPALHFINKLLTERTVNSQKKQLEK